MNWVDKFPQDSKPEKSDIFEFIGASKDLYLALTDYIENNYKSKPEDSFSKCSAQAGWNVKYKKSGKSLCTIYPMNDFFIVLVVIGEKEKLEFESCIDTFSIELIEMYNRSSFVCGGNWLMHRIYTPKHIEDIIKILNMRVKLKK